MHTKRIREFIFSQFEADLAVNELAGMNYNERAGWVERTRATIEEFLPIACPLAEHIAQKVPERLNSPFYLEDMLEAKRAELKNLNVEDEWINRLMNYASISRELAQNLQSQQVSAEIQNSVLKFEKLGQRMYNNGNSIYPDFLYKDRDYSFLPFQNRRKAVHGPCLQGKANPRPSNVPDGIELKTNKSQRMRIDAHAPHIGLHLGFTWDFEGDGRVNINGAWLAFITESDHTESARNSTTTTVKYSFGQDKFISLLDSGKLI